MEKDKKPWMNLAEGRAVGEEGRPPPLRHAGEWPMGPRQWERRWANLAEALPIRNLRQGSQCSLQSQPFMHTHTQVTHSQP